VAGFREVNRGVSAIDSRTDDCDFCLHDSVCGETLRERLAVASVSIPSRKV
jgi:hypothetical protein